MTRLKGIEITAGVTALWRQRASTSPNQVGLISDPFAERAVSLSLSPRQKKNYLATSFAQQMVDILEYRTRAIDDLISQFIESNENDGKEHCVGLVGCGFDSRAYRLGNSVSNNTTFLHLDSERIIHLRKKIFGQSSSVGTVIDIPANLPTMINDRFMNKNCNILWVIEGLLEYYPISFSIELMKNLGKGKVIAACLLPNFIDTLEKECGLRPFLALSPNLPSPNELLSSCVVDSDRFDFVWDTKNLENLYGSLPGRKLPPLFQILSWTTRNVNSKIK